MTVDLNPFVDRAEAVLERPPSSVQGTRTWLVEPFLAALGWDVRGESVAVDVDLDGTLLEYVCRVDSVPAAFVAVEAATEALARERATDLVDAMGATGVDRAIYTNGREFALFAGRDDVESTACSLSDLPERGPDLEAFSAAAARERLAPDSRGAVARRLALRRGALVDAIADELVAAGGSAHEGELESAADRFLDDLLEAFLDPDVDGGPISEAFGPGMGSDDVAVAADDEPRTPGGDGAPPSAGGGVDPPDDENAAPPDDESAEPSLDGDTASAGEGASAPADGSERPASDEDGEYVVRFFDGGRSVGAIGHATSAGALVHAAEYLLERGLSGVDLPWATEDGTVVLAEEPRSEGTAMIDPRELSNGYYLETAGNVRSRSRRVEALAARAGLRAMLTGDWENPG